MTTINLSIPVSIFKEKSAYIAYSPVLDLSTSAKTYEKVKTRFDEIVKIFLDELLRMGTLDDVLTGLGWTKINKSWSAPIQISNELKEIKIPLAN